MTEKDIQLFTDRAEAVHASVARVSSMEEAYKYVVDLCAEKEERKPFPGCPKDLSNKPGKIIAAPTLSDDQFAALKGLADAKAFKLIKEDMRSYLGGVDIGFTFADYGIIDTGTIVLNCPGEELRIATMVSEAHVAVLPVSKIVADAYDIEDVLTEWMKKADYTAFITGPSRTADVERVLTVGAHGPLYLHILLLEEA